MRQHVRIAAPNSLILVLDPDTGELPASLGGGSLAATPTGLAIGTLNEFDGETTVHLGEPADYPEVAGQVLRWQGTLGTEGRVGILNVYNELLLERAAPEQAEVVVWANDSEEPDEIWVLIS